MTWRKHPEDSWAEARRLKVNGAITNLGWSEARLDRELDLSETAKMFVGRVRTAIQKALQDEANQARLLHKDSSRGYTDNLFLGLRGEPEAVSAEYQDQLSSGPPVVHERSVEQSLRYAGAEAERKGVDPTPHIPSIRHQIRVMRGP